MGLIDYDKNKFELLEKAYNEAIKQGLDSFTFQDNEYFVEYAKYLIEHLKNELKP